MKTINSLNSGSPVEGECTFLTASLYNAETDRGFGRDFARSSQPRLQDWVQVACSKKTWNNTRTITTHLYSPSTHADADKVKKINDFSVSTQLSLELK